MAYTLKSTGQALDLIACIRVDQDGVTLKEFVNGWTSTWDGVSAWTDNNAASMTVDDPVVVGSSTWKGVTFPYFEVLANGVINYHGVRFALDALVLPMIFGGGGATEFAAVAGMSASQGSGTFQNAIFEHDGAGEGLQRSTATGPLQWQIGVTFGPATTALPSDGTTKFSFGASYENSENQSPEADFFYGLESGSLAADGNYAGAENRSSTDFTGIGGGDSSGNTPAKYFVVCIFSTPRTLEQMQALHNDFHGELFEASGGGDVTAPTYSVAPVQSAVTSTTVTTTATAADETAAEVDHYSAAYADGSPAPSAAQIVAGTGTGVVQAVSSLAVDNGVAAPLTHTGLDPSTAYDIYRTVGDGTNFAAPQKVDITTSAASFALQLDAQGGNNLLKDTDGGTNRNDTGLEVVVFGGAAAARTLAYQGTADITDGVLDNIVDAAFQTVDETFEVVLIVSGTVMGVFPATVVDLSA